MGVAIRRLREDWLRYIDSSMGGAGHALGTWLATEASPPPVELRLQTGYFSLAGLAPIEPALSAMAANSAVVRMVIGSNAGETPADEIDRLVAMLGIPRPDADLAVVSYGNAIYHPKTWHIMRADGTRTAYVGSANVGRSSFSGLNVEAGLLLDERDGDPRAVLDDISAAVDAWFSGPVPGAERISGGADVQRLLAAGILAAVRPPRSPSLGGTGATSTRRSSRAPLVSLPTLSSAPAGAPSTGGRAAGAVRAAPKSSTLGGYPKTMRFAAVRSSPTSGAGALSGLALPGGAVGLVITLSKDAARHWTGGGGTANISPPLAALEPLLFGFSSSGKPRAQFILRSRFLGIAGTLRVSDADTGVMAYGYGPNPTGNKDVRMLLPRGTAGELLSASQSLSAAAPRPGDYALLEWPSFSQPSFGLTLMDTNSATYAAASSLVAAEIAAGRRVGGSSVWLPPGLSPAW